MGSDEDEDSLQSKIALLQSHLDKKWRARELERVQQQAPISPPPSTQTLSGRTHLAAETPTKSKYDPYKVAHQRGLSERAKEQERKAARESRAVEEARKETLEAKSAVAHRSNVIVAHHSIDSKGESSFAGRLRAIHQDAELKQDKESSKVRTLDFNKRTSTSQRSEAVEKPALNEEISERFAKKAFANIRYGPKFPASPSDDPTWQKIEPISSTRLRKRLLQQAEVQSHVDSSYVLNVSELYSISGPETPCNGRPKSSATIDLPFDQDYLIFGVLTSRSEIYTSANGCKYVIWKLIDFKTLPRDESFSKQIHSTSREISLFCFESKTSVHAVSTHHDLEKPDEDGEVLSQNANRNRSNGSAFQRMWTKEQGTLVALLNPTVIRQSVNGKEQQYRNRLSLSISHADQCLEIGLASQFAVCSAMRADGSRCSDWTDKRWGTGVCEYHATVAIQKVKAARVEFGSGSSFAKPLIGGRPKRSQTGGLGENQNEDPFATKSGRKRLINGVESDNVGTLYVVKSGDSRINGQAIEDGFGREAARRSIAKDEKSKLERAILKSQTPKLNPLATKHTKINSGDKMASDTPAFSVQALRGIGFDPRSAPARSTSAKTQNDNKIESRLDNRKASTAKMKGNTMNRSIDLRNTRAFGSSSVFKPVTTAAVTSSNPPEDADSDLEVV